MEMIIRFYLLPVPLNLESLKTSKKLGIKISKIGKIRPNQQKISLLLIKKVSIY